MNIAELKSAIDSIFTAIDGPPRAYFELPTEQLREWPSNQECILRITYQSLYVGMVGEPDKVQSVLCGWAFLHLSNLITREQQEDRAVVLFWRTHPHLLEGVRNDRPATVLKMRLAIPGYPLVLEPNDAMEIRWL